MGKSGQCLDIMHVGRLAMKIGLHSLFFFNDTATTEIYTLSLHDALPIYEARAQAQGEEPIAYIGHGAFFDRMGNEIQLMQALVEKAQTWYREDMLSALNARQKRDFAMFEQRLYDGVRVQGQARLVVRQPP